MFGLTSNKQYKKLEQRRKDLEEAYWDIKRELVRENMRVRVGTKNFDPITLTSNLRMIEPGIRVEINDQHTMTITANRALSEDELAQVDKILGFELNRT